MNLEKLKKNYRKLNQEEIKKELTKKIIEIENMGDELKTLSLPINIITNKPHPFKRLSIECYALYDVGREKGLSSKELTNYAEKYLITTSKLLSGVENAVNN